jgi:hypothetical protein
VTSRHCRSYDTYSPRLQCNSRVTRLPLEPKSSFHPILRLLLLAIRRKTLTSPSFFILVSSATCNSRLPITGCLLAFAVVEFDLGRFQGGNRERTRPRPDLSLSLLFFSPCPSRSLAPAGDAPSLRSRRRFLGLGNGVSAPSHTHTHTLCPSLSPRLDDQSQSTNPAAEIQIGPAGLPSLPLLPFSRTQTTRPDCYKHHPAQSFKEGTERKSPSTPFRPPILSTPSSSVGALSPLPSPSLSLLYSDPNSQPFDRGHSFFSFIIIPNLYSRGSRRI